MSDLLAEVDEMMRQERLMKLWQKHGNTIVIGIAAIVLGTGVVSGFNAWNDSVKTKHTEALISALQEPSFPANVTEETFEIRPGLKGIGLLNAATKSLEAEKKEDALKFYTQAAEDKSIPSDLRDLAAMNMAKLSDAPAAERIAILEAITKNEKNPWSYHALLEMAVIQAGIEKNYITALETLNKIQDAQNLPDSLYNKARALTHVYTLEMHKQQAGQTQ